MTDPLSGRPNGHPKHTTSASAIERVADEIGRLLGAALARAVNGLPSDPGAGCREPDPPTANSADPVSGQLPDE
jgi:hypothetical protein